MRRAGMTTRLAPARIAACALLFLAVASPSPAQRPRTARTPAPTTTLERIRQRGAIRLGYRTDARPFSFRGAAGSPDGYTVGLCQRVADAVKAELGIATLQVEWVEVTIADRFQAVQDGRIDLLCGAESETLGRRQQVSFSIPVFPDGIGAVLRRDAPARLKEILGERPRTQPSWRASAGQLLQAQTFAVVAGSTAQPWLAGKLRDFKLTATVTPVDAYDAGIRDVLGRRASVFFGDRAILIDLVARNPSGGQLIVLDRFFNYEPVALPLGRGDEAFRLVVDRVLSRLYATPDFRTQYTRWFGEPSPEVLTFFRWNARPD